MTDSDEAFDRAIARLWERRTFRHQGRELAIAVLLRSADWRPLRASWWGGKEVSIIGADLDGNFFLRHCDGTVRLWDHTTRSDMVLAPSIRDFVSRIQA